MRMLAASILAGLMLLPSSQAAHKGWWHGQINFPKEGGKGKLLRLAIPSVVHTDVSPDSIDLPITIEYEVAEPGRGTITPHRNWWIKGDRMQTQCVSTTKLPFDEMGRFSETVHIAALKYTETALLAKGTNWVMAWARRGNLSHELRLPTVFTACNLDGEYRFEVDRFESTWRPGASFLFQLYITDADGERYVVKKAYLQAIVEGEGRKVDVAVEPFLDGYGFPVALYGKIPADLAPTKVAIRGTIDVYGAQGKLAKVTIPPKSFVPSEAPKPNPFPIRELYLCSVTSERGIDAELDMAERANFNEVLMPAFGIGTTMYPSKYFPSKTGDFDALRYCIDKAHGLGLKADAWFSVFYWGIHGNRKTYPPIIDEHPEWLGSGPKGPRGKAQHHLWPCPANPKVHDHLVGMVKEVTANYDIDGVLLDYCRYPGDFYCHCDYCRSTFKAKAGIDPLEIHNEIVARRKLASPRTKPAEKKSIQLKLADDRYEKLKKAWDDYRFDAITTLVAKIRDAVKSVKPDVVIKASTAGSPFPQPNYQRFQDFKTCLEKGYLDYVQTMTYSTFNWPQRWIPSFTIAAARRQAEGLGEMKNRLIVAPANYGRSQYQHNFGNLATRTGRELLPEIKGLEDLGIAGYGLFTAYHLTEDQIQALANLSYDYELELAAALERTAGKVNVLFDNAHGSSGYFGTHCGELVKLFEARGAVKSNNTFPLCDKLLENVDVVVTFPIKPLFYDEAQALERFVKRGGRLVVVGGDYQASVIASSNFFLDRFGIKFRKSKGMQCSPVMAHPVTAGVKAVSIGSPSGELEVSEPAKALMGKDGKVGVAVYEGEGKLLVIADEILLARLDMLDHREFFENVVKWLVEE